MTCLIHRIESPFVFSKTGEFRHCEKRSTSQEIGSAIIKIATESKIMTRTALLKKRLEKNAANGNSLFEPSVQLVAGAGFEPTTFGL